ncbi:hypothetical protein M8J76_010032 [Diaphorina citri]|nr:hypothetical protein M8J76_010032 [Diaphorina citri]KAI5728526.1 hypothetical protein M8J77_017405 [Diaphorina citri]
MKFPTNERFILLTYLHSLGLISLPEYYADPWKNWLHKYCYRNGVYLALTFGFILQSVNTFVFAIQDLSTFFQKMLETLFSLVFIMAGFKFNVKLDSVLLLLHTMDDQFTRTDANIDIKYRNKISIRMKLFAGCLLWILVTFVVDAMMVSQDTVDLWTKLYHHSKPVRILPIMIWIPLLNTNEQTIFLAVCAFEYYLMLLLFILCYKLLIMESTFTLAMAAQYEMLCGYVELVGFQHRNDRQPIYYVDIVKGLYRHVPLDQERIPKNLNIRRKSKEKSLDINSVTEDIGETEIKRRERRKNIYENHFMRLILVRHQQLIRFLNLYNSILYPMMNVISIPVLAFELIAVYQMVYLKNLSLPGQIKITSELLCFLMALYNLMHESDRLDECYLRMRRASYESGWYQLTSPDAKQSLCLLMRFCQRSNYTSVMLGLLVFNHDLLMRTMKFSYTFANFMRLYKM